MLDHKYCKLGQRQSSGSGIESKSGRSRSKCAILNQEMSHVIQILLHGAKPSIKSLESMDIEAKSIKDLVILSTRDQMILKWLIDTTNATFNRGGTLEVQAILDHKYVRIGRPACR